MIISSKKNSSVRLNTTVSKCATVKRKYTDEETQLIDWFEHTFLAVCPYDELEVSHDWLIFNVKLYHSHTLGLLDQDLEPDVKDQIINNLKTLFSRFN